MPTILAPENMPFLVGFGMLALLVLVQLVGVADLGGDVDLDLDADLDADLEVGFGSALASLLGLGRLPLMVWLSTAIASFTVSGLLLQQVLESLTGHYLPALPASGLALLAMVPLTALISRPIARIWPRDETTAIDIESLLARRGRIDIGTSRRGSPARAKVLDQHGQTHLVMVEPHEDGTSFVQGDEVLLVRRDGDLFFAVACERPFLIDAQ